MVNSYFSLKVHFRHRLLLGGFSAIIAWIFLPSLGIPLTPGSNVGHVTLSYCCNDFLHLSSSILSEQLKAGGTTLFIFIFIAGLGQSLIKLIVGYCQKLNKTWGFRFRQNYWAYIYYKKKIKKILVLFGDAKPLQYTLKGIVISYLWAKAWIGRGHMLTAREALVFQEEYSGPQGKI